MVIEYIYMKLKCLKHHNNNNDNDDVKEVEKKEECVSDRE